MSTELETKLQELRKKVADHWQFAMMPNPELTQKQLIGIFSNLRDKLDDALASLPQQDVGAGRSVPSPVGQDPTFTEAQVRAMLRDVIAATSYDEPHGTYRTNELVAEVADRHGLKQP